MPDFQNLLPTRPNYYDRAATLDDNGTFVQNAGTHGATTRWSTTVPSGRKAFIGLAIAGVWCRTGTGGGAEERFTAINLDSLGSDRAWLRAMVFGPNFGDSQVIAVAPGLVLEPGRIFYGITYNGGPNSFNDHLVRLALSEFDQYVP